MQLHKLPPHQTRARVGPRCNRVIPPHLLRQDTKPSSSLEISPIHADSLSTVMANSSLSSSKLESRACAFRIKVDVWTVSKRIDLVKNANLTHGITLSGDGKTLYASSAKAVFSWPYDAAESTASGNGRNIIAITDFGDGDHITRTLLFAKKQENTLIVSRGSETNVDMASLDLTTGHCQIKSFAVQNGSATPQNFNTTGKLLGWGLRNSVGVAEHPLTGGIYSVEMGMDYATRDGKNISQNNPGDELNYHGIIGKANDLNQGLNHGYPYCHAAWDLASIPNRGELVVGNQFLVGDVNDTFTANDTINDAVCAKERAAPVITLPPHNAPIDLKFTADGTEAYISLHGSW